MKKKSLKKILLIVLAIYTAFAVSFYFLAGDQLKYRDSSKNIVMVDADSITPEITSNCAVEQDFYNEVDSIEELAVVFTKQYRDAYGKVTIELLDNNEIIGKVTYDAADIPEQKKVYLHFDDPLRGYEGKQLTLRVSSTCEDGSGVFLMRKSTTQDGSFIKTGDGYVLGTICFSLNGEDKIPLSAYYWYIMGGIELFLIALFTITYKKYEKGRRNFISSGIVAIYNYQFLISQLVARDFKSKYKRSILGVFWSFLNPLLTMIVQFLVFSTIFKVDTQNYPVYLLTGVVCFSFFSECTTMCLTSISGNARLITKVYIPKYIFPVSRTISSLINLGISLIPLFLVCFIMGITLKPAAILFLYFLVCLMVFSLGIGMFLSALMVFFRDIQFLWTVIIQIWQYATPIFYSAEIIPDKYKFIVRFNPLYHYIGNIRTCIMSGVSPEPMSYIYCLLFALISLGIGSYVFKKTQDKFALYL